MISTRHCLIAAAIMHIEGAFSVTTLAFKNNNPGNLRPVGSGVGFQKFATKIDGFNALMEDIAANTGMKIEDFIEKKYAPPSENNSVLYLHLLLEITGMVLGEVI